MKRFGKIFLSLKIINEMRIAYLILIIILPVLSCNSAKDNKFEDYFIPENESSDYITYKLNYLYDDNKTLYRKFRKKVENEKDFVQVNTFSSNKELMTSHIYQISSEGVILKNLNSYQTVHDSIQVSNFVLEGELMIPFLKDSTLSKTSGINVKGNKETNEYLYYKPIIQSDHCSVYGIKTTTIISETDSLELTEELMLFSQYKLNRGLVTFVYSNARGVFVQAAEDTFLAMFYIAINKFNS